jgi:hypothetical protein
MVEGYVMELSMGFLTKYIQDFQAMIQKMWDVEEKEGISGEGLEGTRSQVHLDLTK